jgi:hypothetical protein
MEPVVIYWEFDGENDMPESGVAAFKVCRIIFGSAVMATIGLALPTTIWLQYLNM